MAVATGSCYWEQVLYEVAGPIVCSLLHPLNPFTLHSLNSKYKMPHLLDTRRPGTALELASPSMLICALCLSQAHWRGAGSGRPPLPIHLPRLTGALRYLRPPSEVVGKEGSGTFWILQHLSALETSALSVASRHVGPSLALSLPHGVVWVLSFYGAPPASS